MSRLLAIAIAIPALLLTTAAGPPAAESLELPDAFSPEGIAVGSGSTFYVGSLRDGDIYRGDLRSGAGAVFINTEGRMAVGLKVDEPHHRLVVAGGITGHAFVYDTRTGDPVADVAFAPFGTAFLNDVVVTKDGAYFTDSLNPVLYKLPIAPNGELGAPETIAVSGPAAPIAGDFNLNGITATANGDTLIVGHSALGALFTVDPETGASQPIEVTGGALTPGTLDGILLDGVTLWVVENFANQVVELRVSPDLTSATLRDVVTDAEAGGLFRIPTTVAVHGSQLVLVNARFDQGLPPPLGAGVPADTDYDVVVVHNP